MDQLGSTGVPTALTILSDTDRVVRSDADQAQLLQSGHTQCGGGVDPEHKEGAHDAVVDGVSFKMGVGPADSRDNHALLIRRHAVAEGNHGELANTIADLTSSVVAETSLGLYPLRIISIRQCKLIAYLRSGTQPSP